MAKSSLVVVLGMHRSGTSVITSVVENCGVATGSNLLSAGPDNPKGYWEDEFIVNTNNALLRSLGYEWHSLVWLPLEKLQNSRLYHVLLADSVLYLRDLCSKHPHLVIKDPRMAITLPFWLQVFMQLGVDVSYIIAKRNAAAISHSLQTRDGFDKEYATQLIFLHWSSIRFFLPTQAPVLLVNYEDIKHQEISVRENLNQFLAIKPQAVDQTCFELELDHQGHNNDISGFVWQQDMLHNFPHSKVDVDRILNLQAYYKALSLAYLPSHLTQALIHEFSTIADTFKAKNVALYGASQLASLVVGPLYNNIVIAVDQAAGNASKIQRYGVTFEPVITLGSSSYDCILVCVVGRKRQIMSILQSITTKPIYFLEDLLFSE
jgi:hypothetical protein